jgi:hypothetical protein
VGPKLEKVGSREFLMLRWTTLEKVPVVGAMRLLLYLVAKALGVGPTRHCLVLSCSSGLWQFTGGCEALRSWIFLEVLIVWVPAFLVLEALRHGSREPEHVLSWVTRSGRNRRLSVPWVQAPDSRGIRTQ